jgi:hypothetical protein
MVAALPRRLVDYEREAMISAATPDACFRFDWGDQGLGASGKVCVEHVWCLLGMDRKLIGRTASVSDVSEAVQCLPCVFVLGVEAGDGGRGG